MIYILSVLAQCDSVYQNQQHSELVNNLCYNNNSHKHTQNPVIFRFRFLFVYWLVQHKLHLVQDYAGEGTLFASKFCIFGDQLSRWPFAFCIWSTLVLPFWLLLKQPLLLVFMVFVFLKLIAMVGIGLFPLIPPNQLQLRTGSLNSSWIFLLWHHGNEVWHGFQWKIGALVV